MPDEVNIQIDNRKDDFVNITVKRKWECKKPGHKHHNWKQHLTLRKSEIPMFIEKLQQSYEKPVKRCQCKDPIRKEAGDCPAGNWWWECERCGLKI